MILFDDQFVKVGGILLPGIFKSIEVSGSALVEELEVEGKGKKPKQATGYEDGKVNIEIVLMDDNKITRYEKLQKIQDIFKQKNQSKPKVYNIINKVVNIAGINKVIFKELSYKESNGKIDQINVSMTFWEYESVTISSSKKTGSKSASGNTSSKTAKSNTSSTFTGRTTSTSISSEYSNYLKNRGTAPKISSKTDKTPAKDITPKEGVVKKLG